MSISQHLILVVEEDRVARTVTRNLVARLGFSVEVAPDGPSALRLLQDQPFTVILIDTLLPGLDGSALTQRLRADPSLSLNRATPVIGVSASATADERDRCFAAGMVDLLAKPVSLATLSQSLHQWLVSAAPDLTPEPASPAAASVATFDPAVLIDRMMGNEALARRVVTIFLEETPRQLASLAMALQAADAPEAHRLAHSLQGAAATLGADSFRQIAIDIERLGTPEHLAVAATFLPQLVSSFDELRPTLERFETP